MILGYVRVSTVEQNEGRQLATMQEYGVEKVFSEKVSGKDMNRPQLAELLEFCREGDTIILHDFSRLARSTANLLEIIDLLDRKGVKLISKKENLDTSTPTGRLLVTCIAAINEFERSNLLERQREGIAIAKAKGIYKGRKPIRVEDFGSYYERYMAREFNKTTLAKELHISRQTLYKLIKEYEESPQYKEKHLP